MAAGFAAGITEALVVVTPFEVVKIRLQQQRGLTKELLRYKAGTAPLQYVSYCPTFQQACWSHSGSCPFYSITAHSSH